MTITLTPELESALTSAANRQGTTPELLALDCLRSRFVNGEACSSSAGAGSLADFLADSIGVISSAERVPGGARMSEKSGSQFADLMLKKKQQGRL